MISINYSINSREDVPERIGEEILRRLYVFCLNLLERPVNIGFKHSLMFSLVNLSIGQHYW